MERVAFLIESTGARIGCLLNPETVVVRRWAGVRRRRSLAGTLRADALADDPVLFTGGGTTELELELLFDVGLAGSSVPSSPDGAGAVGDVRDLTLPLWRLAETAEVVERELRPNIVRFLWGKAWNVPAVVSAVAERFEAFGPEGAPRRSWMRMRLLRVADPAPRPPASEGMESLPELAETHQVLGAGIAAGGEGPGPAIPPGERLDELADRYFGDPGAWKEIAELNDVDDPLHLAPGAALRIPIKE